MREGDYRGWVLFRTLKILHIVICKYQVVGKFSASPDQYPPPVIPLPFRKREGECKVEIFNFDLCF